MHVRGLEVLRRTARTAVGRRLSSGGAHGPERFNEPGGSLLQGMGDMSREDRGLLWIYAVGYLGSTALFVFLWQYRADESPMQWADREAARRMCERGFRAEDYMYRRPDVYG